MHKPMSFDEFTEFHADAEEREFQSLLLSINTELEMGSLTFSLLGRTITPETVRYLISEYVGAGWGPLKVEEKGGRHYFTLRGPDPADFCPQCGSFDLGCDGQWYLHCNDCGHAT